ncbi:MSHA biogenesis protein MshC [Shewanella putrefaciens]|nr:MSHA biogenesis protein MshC [Shewanella putrefaciens]
MAKQAGFTLVELVTTIILIAILSVTVLPRLFTQSSYSAFSLRNEFMAELRQVQQEHLNNTDRCYRIAVSSVGYQVSQFATRDNTGCTGAPLSPEPLYTKPLKVVLRLRYPVAMPVVLILILILMVDPH